MNLKELDKIGRESCPDEVDGLARKRKKPKQWKIMLDNHKRAKKKREN